MADILANHAITLTNDNFALGDTLAHVGPKQAKKLVQEHQVLEDEDLQLTNVVRRRSAKQDEDGTSLPNGAAAKGGLNKSILDNGLGQFVQIVVSKAVYAGRQICKVNPQQISQICSECGKKGC